MRCTTNGRARRKGYSDAPRSVHRTIPSLWELADAGFRIRQFPKLPVWNRPKSRQATWG